MRQIFRAQACISHRLLGNMKREHRCRRPLAGLHDFSLLDPCCIDTCKWRVLTQQIGKWAQGMLSSGHFFPMSLHSVSQTTGQADTSNRYIHDFTKRSLKILSDHDANPHTTLILTCSKERVPCHTLGQEHPSQDLA